MHSGPLAFESVTYASVMSMVFGSLLLIMYRFGVRVGGMRLLVLAWYMMCIYFLVLAISAGPASFVLRTQTAIFERIWLIVTFSLFALSYIAIFRSFVLANDRRHWLW